MVRGKEPLKSDTPYVHSTGVRVIADCIWDSAWEPNLPPFTGLLHRELTSPDTEQAGVSGRVVTNDDALSALRACFCSGPSFMSAPAAVSTSTPLAELESQHVQTLDIWGWGGRELGRTWSISIYFTAMLSFLSEFCFGDWTRLPNQLYGFTCTSLR